MEPNRIITDFEPVETFTGFKPIEKDEAITDFKPAESNVISDFTPVEPVRPKPKTQEKPWYNFLYEDPEILKKNPTVYGLYGATKGVAEFLGKIGHATYGDPNEIKQLLELSPEEQKRQLLMDTLEDIFIVSGQAFPKPRPSVNPNQVVQKAKKTGAKVMDLIGKRRAELDKGILDSEIFIKQFEQTLSKAELEAIPFIRQGIKDPNVLKAIGREDLISIIKKPSSDVLKATDKIGKYYDEAYQFLKDNWGDVGFVEDYVTHIWNIPKARRSEVVNYFTTKNPFLKKRTIPTLEEGIKGFIAKDGTEIKLIPKTTNIAELLRIYDQYKIKTVHNMKFAKSLKELTDDAGNAVMKRTDKAPEDWVTVDHPALSRAMMVGKVGKEGIILSKVPVKVHPDIAKEVKIIFDKPFSHAAIRALETVNAFTKKSMLTISFFHHQALTESAFSTGIGKKAIKLWNPYRIYKALRHKDYEIYKHVPLAKDSMDHGVTYGALSDVQRSKVQKALIGLERVTEGVPGLKTATKLFRKANDLWDAALWDHYHNALKMYAYEHNVETGLKIAEKAAIKKFGRSLSPEEITTTKRQIASFVNDSFGGQNWELNKVLGNPKTRQMLHWLLLAPDWTFSVLKQAAAPGKGAYLQMAGQNIGEKLAGKALTKRGAMFWARAGMYYNLMAQSVNYYKTKKEYGKGRFTWENAPGHKLNIFIGKNEDGTERYLRMGKQFREVMEWTYEPEKKLGGKLSPIVRESIRQIARHDPGSGYPTKFEDKDWFESIPERLMSIAEMPIPFSLRGYIKGRPGSFMLTFPTSKGMTNYKTRKLFKEAIKDEDANFVKKIYFSALENNLDAQELFKSAKSEVKADITYDNKEMARDILKEFKKVDSNAKMDLFKYYKERGIITPDIEQKLNNLLLKEEKINKQKLIFGIK